MADRKKRLRIGLVVLVAISLLVCPLAAGGFGLGGANAQIAFTPNVSTLVLTRTVEGPGLELGATVEPRVTPVETHIPVTDGAWMVEGLTSAEAIARCGGRTLTSGDTTRGMCLAPGGETYYVWIDPNEVMEVVRDSGDLNQSGFQVAAAVAVNDRVAVERGQWTRVGAFGGAVGAVLAFPPACLATLVGCFGGALAIMGGVGGAIAASDALACDQYRLETHIRQTEYYYCLMQGNDDGTCRQTAGITETELGGPCE
jgi:hypothetical protein